MRQTQKNRFKAASVSAVISERQSRALEFASARRMVDQDLGGVNVQKSN
ncbi:hypothetical protein [Marinomonas aquiplantarum]|uniref:Uncharacterized protein n=1 Tax=Marinomonas aquiplantarum TaxID=491951 RepID=A0A366CZI1_9GAMM|nr:hypothetical protein [Marinomonas aquiplantarum]RBO82649.1 hypothetical protein DFP76_105114 [Marinomonas aquiplantarum]